MLFQMNHQLDRIYVSSYLYVSSYPDEETIEQLLKKRHVQVTDMNQ